MAMSYSFVVFCPLSFPLCNNSPNKRKRKACNSENIKNMYMYRKLIFFYCKYKNYAKHVWQ